MVYVFDMDGVLVNSAILGGIEAVNALESTKPGDRILSVRAAEQTYLGFEQAIEIYRPLLVYGPEFVPICDHFSKTFPTVENRGQFEEVVDKYMQEIGTDKYERLCSAFANVRKSLPNEHPQDVIDLLVVYRGVLDIINSAKEKGPVYVSSSNQMARKRLEMLNFGIDGERVFTKSTHGKTKKEHLEKIAKRESVDLSDVIMVEDNLSEIIQLHDLGADLVMASWGYNTPHQKQVAERYGAKVLDQKNLLTYIGL